MSVNHRLCLHTTTYNKQTDFDSQKKGTFFNVLDLPSKWQSCVWNAKKWCIYSTLIFVTQTYIFGTLTYKSLTRFYTIILPASVIIIRLAWRTPFLWSWTTMPILLQLRRSHRRILHIQTCLLSPKQLLFEATTNVHFMKSIIQLWSSAHVVNGITHTDKWNCRDRTATLCIQTPWLCSQMLPIDTEFIILICDVHSSPFYNTVLCRPCMHAMHEKSWFHPLHTKSCQQSDK